MDRPCTAYPLCIENQPQATERTYRLLHCHTRGLRDCTAGDIRMRVSDLYLRADIIALNMNVLCSRCAEIYVGTGVAVVRRGAVIKKSPHSKRLLLLEWQGKHSVVRHFIVVSMPGSFASSILGGAAGAGLSSPASMGCRSTLILRSIDTQLGLFCRILCI